MAITEYFIRFLQRRDSLPERDLARLRALRTQHVSFASGEVIVPVDRVAAGELGDLVATLEDEAP